jgi:predicted ATPase/DNA-binding SARP family transcriptional activator/predicted negative regulator of RcsB-dependent stress response
MPDLKIYLLGTPRVTRGDVVVEIGRRKATAVLSYLLLIHQILRRETLVAFFWPEHSPSQGRADLSRILSVLRKTMGEGWLVTDRQTVGVGPEADIWIDVLEFRRLLGLAQSHYHAEGQVCEACLTALSAATDLYQGDFMAGFTLAGSPEFDDWQSWQTESLCQELANALGKLARWHALEGDYQAALKSAQRRLNLDPLHEPAQRQLMRIYAWSGNRSAAIRQYQACRRTLDIELGLPPAEATRELYEAIQAGQAPPPPHITGTNERPANVPQFIPAQPTPFVGRQEELAQIETLILGEPACRLLTLVGPGGMGKTRLAVQAAMQMVKEAAGVFPDGVYFVSLAPTNSSDALISAIAESLNLSFYGSSTPQEQLLKYLSRKRMLLVLDNLEHLLTVADFSPQADIEEAIELLTAIINRAPQVKLLVTSRERLNLQEEWALDVPGMAFPSSAGVDETALGTYSATELFLQRARRARATFVLTETDIANVIRICQLVAGVPLGIELAAAWVRMMSCEDIVREIERGLDFLTTSLRDVPERHRSLRTVFEQSWSHLSEKEKAVFKKLSVFQGGFRLRAAERIAGATLPALSALADKSLVRRTRGGRYEIHELLRQFADEKLVADIGENGQTKDLHAEFYAAFMDSGGRGLKGGDEQNALVFIDAEIGNVRAGWRWAMNHADHALIDRYLEGLALFHEIRGWYHEGLGLLDAAVEALRHVPNESRTQQRVVAKLLGRQASINFALTRYKKATRLLEESLAILKRIRAQEEMGYPYRILGDVLNSQGFVAEADRLYRQSLFAYESQRDRTGSAWASNRLGWVAIKMGNFNEAEKMLDNSLSYFREVDHQRGLIWTLNDLGFLLRRRGEYQHSQQHHRESLSISKLIGFHDGIAWSLYELADAQRDAGLYEEAYGNLERSLAIYRELGSLDAALCLYRLGYLLILQGQPRQAEPYLNESLVAYRQVGSSEGLAITQCFLGELALLKGDRKTAIVHFEQSLALFKGISDEGNSWGMLRVLDGLSRTYLSMGELQATCTALLELVDLARQLSSLPSFMNGLIGQAFVLAREGHDRKAVDLLAVPLNHSATRKEGSVRAQLLLDEIAARLPDNTVQERLQSGHVHTPWEMSDPRILQGTYLNEQS